MRAIPGSQRFRWCHRVAGHRESSGAQSSVVRTIPAHVLRDSVSIRNGVPALGHRAGVRIYVDVVLNHMAGQADVMIGTAGSTAVFENRSYPSVPYVNSDFHRPCKIIHFKDAHMVRNCDLYALPDLDQALESVRQRIAELLNRLLDLGVAGFRIGSSKHMWPNDLKVFWHDISVETC